MWASVICSLWKCCIDNKSDAANESEGYIVDISPGMIFDDKPINNGAEGNAKVEGCIVKPEKILDVPNHDIWCLRLTQ
jgi:hypothetical protein